MPRPSSALFALTIFASSFLIFLVQPMVGKHIVPWFGGTPAVWLLCQGFRPLLEQHRENWNLKIKEFYAYYPDEIITEAAPRWTDEYSDLLSVIKFKWFNTPQTFREPAASPPGPAQPSPTH